jgi:plastocyanin
MRTLVRLAATVLLSLSALATQAPLAHADDAHVTITDAGFDPPTITVNPNSNVIWTNTGSKVHTATSVLGPALFDVGGMGPTESRYFLFSVPGTYHYTSATDCLNSGGNPTAGFDCNGGFVVVTGNVNGGNTAPPPTPTPTPIPTALAGPPQDVAVHVSDSGFSPATVTVALGGSVTWVNDVNTVHNVKTVGGGNAMTFDSGGFGAGNGPNYSFNIPGTYTYTDSTACLNGPLAAGFDCTPATIIVSPQPSQLAPTAQITPVAVAQAGTAPAVGIADGSGFSPQVLAIHVGQTVTWTNNGTQVHSVVSDPGYPQQFDSGGLGAGATFSHTFSQPGSFSYHSSTEPSYYNDQFGRLVTVYAYTGTIQVQ